MASKKKQTIKKSKVKLKKLINGEYLKTMKIKLEQAFQDFNDKKIRLSEQKIIRSGKIYNTQKNKSWGVQTEDKNYASKTSPKLETELQQIGSPMNERRLENQEKISKKKTFRIGVARIFLRQFLVNKKKYSSKINSISSFKYVPRQLLKIILKEKYKLDQINKKNEQIIINQDTPDLQKIIQILKILLTEYKNIKEQNEDEGRLQEKIKLGMINFFRKRIQHEESHEESMQMQEEEESHDKIQNSSTYALIKRVPQQVFVMFCSTVIVNVLSQQVLKNHIFNEEQFKLITDGDLLQRYMNYMLIKIQGSQMKSQNQQSIEKNNNYLSQYQKHIITICKQELQKAKFRNNEEPIEKPILFLSNFFKHYFQTQKKLNKEEPKKNCTLIKKHQIKNTIQEEKKQIQKQAQYSGQLYDIVGDLMKNHKQCPEFDKQWLGWLNGHLKKQFA